jgi:hypothetical protein
MMEKFDVERLSPSAVVKINHHEVGHAVGRGEAKFMERSVKQRRCGRIQINSTLDEVSVVECCDGSCTSNTVRIEWQLRAMKPLNHIGIAERVADAKCCKTIRFRKRSQS